MEYDTLFLKDRVQWWFSEAWGARGEQTLGRDWSAAVKSVRYEEKCPEQPKIQRQKRSQEERIGEKSEQEAGMTADDIELLSWVIKMA